MIWKIDLKFLDLKINKWPELIAKRLEEYNNLKEAFLMKIHIERNFLKENSQIIEEQEESKDSSSKSNCEKSNNHTFNNSKSKLSKK